MQDMTSLSREGLYPVRDFPTNIEGIDVELVPIELIESLRAYWNGEERCPKKGEWYLKGGKKLEACRAEEDLGVKYPIVGLAVTKPCSERLIVRLLN